MKHIRLTSAKLAHVALSLAMATNLTACMNSDRDNTYSYYTQSFTSNITAVFYGSETTPTYYQGQGYQVEYNVTDMTATLVVSGLQLPHQSFGTLAFSDMPWSYNGTWKTISQTDVQPSSALLSATFDILNFRVYDRMVTSTSYFPLLDVNYTIGNYKVYSLPPVLLNLGDTTVEGPDMTTYLTSDNGLYYYITLSEGSGSNLNNDDERLATMTIEGMAFDSAMSGMTLLLYNVPYEVKNDGNVYLSIDELTPYQLLASNEIQELDKYTISNLQCVANSSNRMTLSYTCTIVNAYGEIKEYNVSATSAKPE